MFAPTFMRHMYDYGTTPEQVAHVKVIHSEHASNNPKAYYKKRFTVEDVLNSRIICKPLHLLDCCVETDNATCDHRHHAPTAPRTCSHPLVLIRGVVGRCSKPRARHALPARADLDASPATTRKRDPVAERRASGRRMSTSPAPTTPSPSPPCCSSRITASARRARAATTVSDGTITARRQAAQQHQRRPSVRGLHARHEHGDRERAPAAPRRRRFLPGRRRRQAPAHLRLHARAAAARSRMRGDAPISAGPIPATGSAMVMRRG